MTDGGDFRLQNFLEYRNSKPQIPSPKEASITKLQDGSGALLWALKVGGSLEIGAWNLVFWAPMGCYLP